MGHKQKQEQVTYLDHLVKAVMVYTQTVDMVALEAAAGMEAAALVLMAAVMMIAQVLVVQDLFGLKVIKI